MARPRPAKCKCLLIWKEKGKSFSWIFCCLTYTIRMKEASSPIDILWDVIAIEEMQRSVNAKKKFITSKNLQEVDFFFFAFEDGNLMTFWIREQCETIKTSFSYFRYSECTLIVRKLTGLCWSSQCPRSASAMLFSLEQIKQETECWITYNGWLS